jgi:hypothetical protein
MPTVINTRLSQLPRVRGSSGAAVECEGLVCSFLRRFPS